VRLSHRVTLPQHVPSRTTVQPRASPALPLHPFLRCPARASSRVCRGNASLREACAPRAARSQLLLTSARAEMSCTVELAAASGEPRGVRGRISSGHVSHLGREHARTQLSWLYSHISRASEQNIRCFTSLSRDAMFRPAMRHALPARPRTCLACRATAQLSFRGVPEAYCWPGWPCSARDPEVLMASDGTSQRLSRGTSLVRKPGDTAVSRRGDTACDDLRPHPARFCPLGNSKAE